MATRSVHRLIVGTSILVLAFGLAALSAAWAQSAPTCLPNTLETYPPPLPDTAPGPAPGVHSLAGASRTGSIFTYHVPSDVAAVFIKAIGAGGGGSDNAPFPGGNGAEVTAEVPVVPGAMLDVLVGQHGSRGNNGGGGGGGSFVFTTGGELLVAAGGGGGAGVNQPGRNAQTGTSGGDGSQSGLTGGAGGTAGKGGAVGSAGGGNGGGGGGYLGIGGGPVNAGDGAGGHQISGSPPDGTGGAGASSDGADGGYGGGGGGGNHGGGGGGGYSGGGGGTGSDASDGGGGGGSYVAPGAADPAFSILGPPNFPPYDGAVTICATRLAPVTAIPTLSPWALILLALGLALAATPMLVRRA